MDYCRSSSSSQCYFNMYVFVYRVIYVYTCFFWFRYSIAYLNSFPASFGAYDTVAYPIPDSL